MRYNHNNRNDIIEFCNRTEEKICLNEKLEKINILRKKNKLKLIEKSAIAMNINILIENYTKKLDNDLVYFETEYIIILSYYRDNKYQCIFVKL